MSDKNTIGLAILSFMGCFVVGVLGGSALVKKIKGGYDHTIQQTSSSWLKDTKTN
jgi:hypothetical protein